MCESLLTWWGLMLKLTAGSRSLNLTVSGRLMQFRFIIVTWGPAGSGVQAGRLAVATPGW